VTVVACTPTYALRLVEVAGEEGIDLAASKVRVLIVAGEPGGSVPSVRGRIEAAWGARCLDHWGMTEVGPLGFEPLERPGGMHLIETHCIAEVIDPERCTPLRESGRGELVITTLDRPGSPLLRYRTGDLVEYRPGDTESSRSEAVAPLSPDDIQPLTGRPFVRFDGGVLGRIDQMVLVRGNNVYPAAIDAVARLFAEVAEYQAEVVETTSGNRLRIRVELDAEARGGAADFCARFARAFQDRYFFRPEVEVAPPGSLPRFEAKARRFVVRKGSGT
jgi:phenylacetate-CoA ligase